ncbi:MAG: RNA ligase family protein [Myxococcota bacterium]
MHKFDHIGALYQVARYVDSVNGDGECPERYKVRSAVAYRGSVKLHGCNAGVACSTERLSPQSRSRTVSVEDDNYGFAEFVSREPVARAIRAIERRIRSEHAVADESIVVLYGEWIGPGIQRGVAINSLPSRQWVLFAVKVVEGEESRIIDALPSLEDTYADEAIFSVVDAGFFELSVDFADNTSKEDALAYAMRLTADVESGCPWAKRFGVSGAGEGIVWVPVGAHWGNTSLVFKTKGEKHKNTKTKRSKVQISPEVLRSIAAFVEFAVTENRLGQGIESTKELGHAIEMRSMGTFLKWVAQDVRRECALDLEASQLEWKDVSKAVTQKARSFFVEHVHRGL